MEEVTQAAVGYSNGNVVLEKNLTLEITYKVKEILENAVIPFQ